MGLLFFLLLLFIIYYYVFGNGSKRKTSLDNPSIELNQKLAERDRLWLNFLKNQYDDAKSTQEKKYIEKLYKILISQGLFIPADMQLTESNDGLSHKKDVSQVEQTIPAQTTMQPIEHSSSKQQLQLDNASLLLYFGAFLFVAAAGLFVVFGGISGAFRTVIVALVAAAMYITGLHLYRAYKKFAQAGLAFLGIGISIAPLTGLAAYSYIFDQQQGALVWFATSLSCMALYLHAVVSVRKPLLNYVFIFTFLSLFQSTISLFEAPLYVFGWGLSIVGILLLGLNSYLKLWDDFKEASSISSQLLIPASIFLSLIILPAEGAFQLAITLLLASSYYYINAVDTATEPPQRAQFAVATHALLLGSISSFAYSASSSWSTVAVVMSTIGLLEAVIIAVFSKQSQKNFASVALIAQVLVLLPAISSYDSLLYALAITIILGLSVYRLLKEISVYAIAVISSFTGLLVYGQFYRNVALSSSVQVGILLLPIIGQFLYVLYTYANKKNAKQMYEIANVLVVSIVGLSFIGYWASAYTMIGLVAILSVLLVAVGMQLKEMNWVEGAGLISLLPILRGATDGSEVFLIATVVALASNILLSLYFKRSLNRWVASLLWLLLPIGLGAVDFIGVWREPAYAIAYLLVLMGLLFSRAVARGQVYLASDTVVSSLDPHASVGYVFGASAAAFIAGLLATSSQLGTFYGTLIYVVIFGLVYVAANYIEKKPSLYVLMPILAQAILWSILRPEIENNSAIIIYTALSSTLSVLWYYGSVVYFGDKDIRGDAHRGGALLSSFIVPLSWIVIADAIWTMPIGALIAVSLLYAEFKDQSQNIREAIIFGALASIWWLLWIFGVSELQVYTHVLVAILALFAYWRHARFEKDQSRQYIIATLSVATVPLVLQALQSESGGLYGWWLLLEQILIILIGMSINNRFVIRWGLYVALAAVLYQLRDLGWAALAVLALFIISTAIYKIQKYGDEEEKK